MPLYEYRCPTCGASFERIEHVPGHESMQCPICGGSAVRQLGAPALRFKGSGWYVTDYGKYSHAPHQDP